MMGRTHALTGAVAGLALAPLVGLDTVGHAALFAVVTAGWALVPDLDHPHSSASRLLGPITRVLSLGLRSATGAFYRLTKGPNDERGTHRTVTHTGLWALLVGVLLGWLGTVSPWTTVGVAAFGLLLAADRLGGWLLPATLGGLLLWAGTGTSPAAMLAQAGELSWTIGLAAGAGCLVHTLGDLVTRSGAPLIFPVPIAGETYYEVRPPSVLRFTTGGRFENWVVTPLSLAALALLALPIITTTFP